MVFCFGNYFGLGGVRILVAMKQTDKIFDVKHVNDRLMILLIGKKIVARLSTYVPQQGLASDVKDKFSENLIFLVSKISDIELVMIGGEFNK